MTKEDMLGVLVASLAGGILKTLRLGKLSVRRWAMELIGAVLIGNLVFNLMTDYTEVSQGLSLSVVSICAVIWTHLLDLFKEYITKKVQDHE